MAIAHIGKCSLADYAELVLSLFPRGMAWCHKQLQPLATAIAEECRRIHVFAEQLLDEADPRTTTELINEWEADWGLPAKCTGQLSTLEERRAALTNRVVGMQDQSRQTWIEYAARIGYVITITEYAAGDTVPGRPDIPPADAAFAVQINAPLTSYRERQMGEEMGGAFASWGDNSLLECSMQEIVPSHLILLFSYT